MAALQPGLQLAGRYTLERRLGNGGMAEVWSAVDGKRREHVAIKALHASLAAQPAMIELLRNEYRNVRKLDHPHVLRALAFHDESNPPFLVFELAERGDFRRYVGASPGEFLPRLLPVVDALAAAHAQGVVHRDLKLANVLIDARGEARLADFGIAAVLDGDGLALRTGGTPATMSPQQLARERATPADDLYALGLMLYELLAGAPPPAGASSDEITASLRTRLTEAARVPDDLVQLVAELLEPDPTRRPPSMQAVHARLKQALAASVTTIPPEVADIGSAGPARFEQVALVSPRLARAAESARENRAAPLAFRVRFAIAGALALVTAVMLFTWLPRTLPKPPPVTSMPAPATPAKPASSLEIPGPAPFELAKLARAREEAKTLVDRVVELQDQAEERGALEWAAQDYADATARAQTGDELFKGQDYDGARAAYEEAARALETVLGRADSVLSENLEKGWAAYAANDAAAATSHFELAAKIDPRNADAQRGLRRAAVLNEVRTLLADASSAEREGRVDEALASYRRAAGLDGEVDEARTGVERLTGRIGRSNFDEAMSQGFAALDRGDEAAARAAFTRAHTLDPNSNAASDALAQVDTRVRVGQFEAQKAQAAEAEASEQWARAAEIYDQVLAADPTLVFAQKGATRAREMAKLHQQIDEQLAAPERLATDAVYANAQALVRAAANLPGAELARKRDALADAIEKSRVPVHVRLESDNATDVVLHQVDQLGRFTVRELDLRPGTYTAVGTREGYRDVRRNFTVVAGQTPAPVVIQCEERI